MSWPKEGSREIQDGIIVSVPFDWCRSPTAIIPYKIWARQKEAANLANTVRQTDLRTHAKESIVLKCHGDEPGIGGGIKSGTNTAECTPKTWSETVRVENRNIVRHTDEWWMNHENTWGKLLYTEDMNEYATHKPEWFEAQVASPAPVQMVPQSAQLQQQGAIGGAIRGARAGGAAGSRLGPWGALGAGLAGAVVGAYAGSRTSRKLPCPCIVGPYGTIRKNCSIYCSDGQAHHIVPDYTLRYVARKDGMASSGRIPNLGPNFYGGISICLEGQAGDDGSEHWEAHGMDPVIKSLGNQQPGTPLQPKGTAPIGQIIGLSKAQINAIRPDCKALVDKLVDMEFDNTNMNSLGRTTADTLPTGDALTALKGGISNTVH